MANCPDDSEPPRAKSGDQPPDWATFPSLRMTAATPIDAVVRKVAWRLIPVLFVAVEKVLQAVQGRKAGVQPAPEPPAKDVH